MVERHEGPESRRSRPAGSSASRRPSTSSGARDAEPLGFLAQLRAGASERIDGDPAARRGPMPSGTAHPVPARRSCSRFSMDRDAYQALSRSFNVVTMRCTQEWLRRPRLSWYYRTCGAGCGRAADGATSTWGAPRRPTSRSAAAATASSRATGGGGPLELARADERARARRRAGAARRRYARARAVAAGVRRSGAAGPARPSPPRGAGGQPPPPLPGRPGRRRRRPTLAGCSSRPSSALRADPRDDKLLRALDRTYLRPSTTQEAAAELLGLPFSTYRGHLSRGLERVSEWLWQRELYGPETR